MRGGRSQHRPWEWALLTGHVTAADRARHGTHGTPETDGAAGSGGEQRSTAKHGERTEQDH